MIGGHMGYGVAGRRWLCVAVTALLSAGCGEARLPCVPATCSVVVDGKPYGPVTASFYREGAKKTDPGSSATIDANGSGKISTYELGDGLPEGDYKVTVMEGGIGASKLAKSYANESSTPLKVKVFKNSDVIKLELEAPKTKGSSGVRIPGAKSSGEMVNESSPQ